MFRPSTVEEQILFNLAPSWTKSITGACKHEEVHVYPSNTHDPELDNLIECAACGLCLPVDGKW